jgi:hypothetical protein
VVRGSGSSSGTRPFSSFSLLPLPLPFSFCLFRYSLLRCLLLFLGFLLRSRSRNIGRRLRRNLLAAANAAFFSWLRRMSIYFRRLKVVLSHMSDEDLILPEWKT